MKQIKRFFALLLVIVGFYSYYYYQPDIKTFVSSPLSFLKNDSKETLINGKKKDVNQLSKTKVVYVDESDAVIDVIDKASPAVVSIVRKEVLFDPFNGPFKSENSIGTGFIVDGEKGIIFTNRHVVEGENVTYSVVLGDGEKTFDVDKIYRDPVNDFAILQITTNGEVLTGLNLGDSDKLKVGQTVVAIGNALGQFGNSATKGIISGLGRLIYARSSIFGPPEALKNVIQTDAALNPGNSGGPLLNLSGDVVGINVAISQGGQNIGFSIPVNSLKRVVDGFYKTGKISHPFLGVEYNPIDKDMAKRAEVPVGAFIQTVVADSPAQKAGIKPGDIILKINGIRLDEKTNSLRKVIAEQKVGTEIEIVLQRDGKEVTVKAMLKDLAK